MAQTTEGPQAEVRTPALRQAVDVALANLDEIPDEAYELDYTHHELDAELAALRSERRRLSDEVDKMEVRACFEPDAYALHARCCLVELEAEIEKIDAKLADREVEAHYTAIKVDLVASRIEERRRFRACARPALRRRNALPVFTVLRPVGRARRAACNARVRGSRRSTRADPDDADQHQHRLAPAVPTRGRR